MNQDHSFWDSTQVLHFRLCCWLWELLHFFQVILAHSNRYNGHLNWIHPLLFIFVPKMSMFSLAISCLTMTNLPWFMGLIFQVPMKYCSLQHQALLPSPVTSTTGSVFTLAHPFIFPGVISPLISGSILSTYRPREFPFQYPIILPVHTVHGVLKAKILKWFAIPLSSGLHSMRHLHHAPPILGCPAGTA